MMAEAGTYLVPTLCVSSANEYLMAHGSPAYQLEKLALAQKAHKDSIRNGVRAGVTICCGTDLLPSDPFEGTTATIREVELFTEVGLSPLEAIRGGDPKLGGSFAACWRRRVRWRRARRRT